MKKVMVSKKASKKTTPESNAAIYAKLENIDQILRNVYAQYDNLASDSAGKLSKSLASIAKALEAQVHRSKALRRGVK